MYGYGFLARKLLQRRRLLLAGVSHSVCMELLYTVRLLQGPQNMYLFTGREPLNRSDVVFQTSCVVVILGYDTLMYRDFIWLLSLPHCILIVMTHFVLEMPMLYLHAFTCFLWNVRGHVDVPYVAQHYSVLQQFVSQNRSCLWQKGLLFGSEADNVCCNINLGPWVPFGYLVTQAQTRFRHRKHCAIIIQRAVKQWLYRPDICLGQQIIYGLNAGMK